MRSISKLSQIGNYSVLAMANKECEWMMYINLPAEVLGKICQEDPRRVRKLRGAHLTHGPNRQIYPNLIVVIHPSCLHRCYSKPNLASSCHVHAFKDAALSDMSQNQQELSLSKVSPATCKRHLPMICPAERPSRPQLLTDVLIILLYHASYQ